MKKHIAAESIPSTSDDKVEYETTPRKLKYEIEGEQEYDDDSDVVEEEVRDFEMKNIGEITSPYLTPYFTQGVFSIKIRYSKRGGR